MGRVIKPLHYDALLDTKQTEQGIKLIKDFFQQNLSTELRLRRVTALQSGSDSRWQSTRLSQVMVFILI